MNMKNTDQSTNTDLFCCKTSFSNILMPINDMPKINNIISVIVDPSIVSYKVVKTMKGKSIEGQNLSGKKLRAEIQIHERVLYAADEEKDNIHLLEQTFYHIEYVDIPIHIYGTEVEKLVAHHLFRLNVHLNHLNFKLHSHKIFITLFLKIECNIKKTYQLCFSKVDPNNNLSYINLCFADGSNRLMMRKESTCHQLSPKWSPTGQHIAYLSNESGSYMLYIYDIRFSMNKMLTSPDIFQIISSFCWISHSSIVFSAVTGHNKVLYIYEIQSQSLQQLTYCDPPVSHIKPSCFSQGQMIAFIGTASGYKNLHLIDLKTQKECQLTYTKNIKEFKWHPNKQKIVYVNYHTDGNEMIELLDILTCTPNPLNIPNKFYNIKKLSYLKNENVVFIANNGSTDDIYEFNPNTHILNNLTNHVTTHSLLDYVYDIDETTIYFTAQLNGCSALFILKNGQICPICKECATITHLDYRPKII